MLEVYFLYVIYILQASNLFLRFQAVYFLHYTYMDCSILAILVLKHTERTSVTEVFCLTSACNYTNSLRVAVWVLQL